MNSNNTNNQSVGAVPQPQGYSQPAGVTSSQSEIPLSKSSKDRRTDILNLLQSGFEPNKKDEKGNISTDYSKTFLAKILKKISILGREKNMIIIDTILLLVCVGINIWMFSRINQLRIKNLDKTPDPKKVDNTTLVMWLLIGCISINILTIIMRLFIFRFNLFSIPETLTGYKPWKKSSLILGFNLLCQFTTSMIFLGFLQSEDEDSNLIKRDYGIFVGVFALIILIISIIRHYTTGTPNPQFENDRKQIREIDENIAGEVISFLNDKDGKATQLEQMTNAKNYYQNAFNNCQVDLEKAMLGKVSSQVPVY